MQKKTFKELKFSSKNLLTREQMKVINGGLGCPPSGCPTGSYCCSVDMRCHRNGQSCPL